MGRRFLKFTLVLILFLTYGCASSRLPRLDVAPHYFRPCRIVLIPFKNETNDPAISRLLYRVFMNALIEDPSFQVIPEGQVRHFMIMERLLIGKNISPSLRKLLAQRMKAQALVSGRVLKLEKKNDNIKLAFIIEVRDIKTGKLLWSTYHARTAEEYRKILHFGRVYTVTGLVERMVQEVLDQWHAKHLGGCS